MVTIGKCENFSFTFPSYFLKTRGENFPKLGVKLSGIKHRFLSLNFPGNIVEYS
jgi:hypothetical protein